MPTYQDTLPTVSPEFSRTSIEAKRLHHQEAIEILHDLVQRQVEQLLAAFCSADLDPAIGLEAMVEREEVGQGVRWNHYYSDREDAETALLLGLTSQLENSASMFVGDLLGRLQAAKERSWQAKHADQPDAAETLRRLVV